MASGLHLRPIGLNRLLHYDEQMNLPLMYIAERHDIFKMLYFAICAFAVIYIMQATNYPAQPTHRNK